MVEDRWPRTLPQGRQAAHPCRHRRQQRLSLSSMEARAADQALRAPCDQGHGLPLPSWRLQVEPDRAPYLPPDLPKLGRRAIGLAAEIVKLRSHHQDPDRPPRPSYPHEGPLPDGYQTYSSTDEGVAPPAPHHPSQLALHHHSLAKNLKLFLRGPLLTYA